MAIFSGVARAQDVAAIADVTPVADESSEHATTHAPDRMFGVLPNYATVERQGIVAPIAAREMFTLNAKNTFDAYVFPFVALTASLGQRDGETFSQRYATAFADNAIGNFLTSAVLPAALHEDPRYYQRGTGGFGSRAGYALSRIAITRSSSGRPQLNVSELAGNFAASAVANAYYPAEGRSLTATLTRWGSQMMWDAASNELKEFWPDIRAWLQRRRAN